MLKLTQPSHWLLLALVLISGQWLTAQKAFAQVRRMAAHAAAPVRNEKETHGFVKQMPTFRGGGNRELLAYIQQQVRWPQGAGLIDVEGRIYVSFMVGKDGLVHDAKILKGLHPLFDAEALRLVQTLTGFAPGRQHGKPVAMRMTVPVTFRLE